MATTLPDLIAAARQMIADTERTFGALTTAQLNWKPGVDQWSVGQCFDHLQVTKEPYFQIIEQVLNGTKPRSLWEKVPFWPRFIGKQIIKATQPESARKVKTRPPFEPAQSSIDPHILQSFIAQEQRWIKAIERTSAIDSATLIITSPVAAMITYSLLDAMQLMAVHERRHFQQAERVMQTAGFPS